MAGAVPPSLPLPNLKELQARTGSRIQRTAFVFRLEHFRSPPANVSYSRSDPVLGNGEDPVVTETGQDQASQSSQSSGETDSPPDSDNPE